MLRVGDDSVAAAVFRAGLGLGGGGRLRRPVGVDAELLGQVHVASFGRGLAGAAEPGQTLERRQVEEALTAEKYTMKRQQRRRRGGGAEVETDLTDMLIIKHATSESAEEPLRARRHVSAQVNRNRCHMHEGIQHKTQHDETLKESAEDGLKS